MAYGLNRTPGRFAWALAVLLICASFGLVLMGGTARADSSDWFCPWNNGNGGTISLAANDGCTSSFYNALTEVAYYHASGPTVNHCALSKYNSDGSGSNALPPVCGYGAAPYGELNTAYYAPGLYSYARGKNNEGVTHYDFYGLRWWK